MSPLYLQGIRGMSTLEQASAAPFSEAGGIGLRLTDIRQSSIIQNAQEKVWLVKELKLN